MKSEIFSDTIKIGKGITVEGRLKTLDNDTKFYGFFKLKPIYFIKLKNYGKLEKTLHNYFDSLRISQDRELFRNIDEREFIEFLKINYIDNSRLKNDIIEHNLPI